MANKGQKLKKHSPKLKEIILNEYFKDGFDSYSLGRKYDVSPNTIRNWVRKVRINIDVRTDHRKGKSGRPKTKNLTLEDYKERYEILKKYQAFLRARREKK